MSDDREPKLPTEVANKFIELQSKELDVRIKEVDIEAGDLQNKKEVAIAHLDAQLNDRNEERTIYSKESTKSKYFAIAVLLILCAFILILVNLGQSGMAQKILEIGFSGCLGAFGGYGYAKYTDFKDQSGNDLRK